MTKVPTQARVVQVDGYPTPPLVRWMNDTGGRIATLEGGADGVVIDGQTVFGDPDARFGLDGGSSGGLPDLGDPIFISRYLA